MWQRALIKLTKGVLFRGFNTAEHAVIEKVARHGKPVMGFVRSNGDIITQPIEIEPKEKPVLRATGTTQMRVV